MRPIAGRSGDGRSAPSFKNDGGPAGSVRRLSWPCRPRGAASLLSQGETRYRPPRIYLFGRDALTPGGSKEFNDKTQWSQRRRCSRLADGPHPSVQKFQSARAHAGKAARDLRFLARSTAASHARARSRGTSRAPGSRANQRRASARIAPRNQTCRLVECSRRPMRPKSHLLTLWSRC